MTVESDEITRPVVQDYAIIQEDSWTCQESWRLGSIRGLSSGRATKSPNLKRLKDTIPASILIWEDGECQII